jgi:hypothetical protein
MPHRKVRDRRPYSLTTGDDAFLRPDCNYSRLPKEQKQKDDLQKEKRDINKECWLGYKPPDDVFVVRCLLCINFSVFVIFRNFEKFTNFIAFILMLVVHMCTVGFGHIGNCWYHSGCNEQRLSIYLVHFGTAGLRFSSESRTCAASRIGWVKPWQPRQPW